MSIKWHRKRDISKEEYLASFRENAKTEYAREGGDNSKTCERVAKDSKIEKAYEKAADIRKFEIELFWKRATYFWAFITSIYVAFFNVQKTFYYDEARGFEHGTLPLLALSALGFFFCLAWLFSTYASKSWQENWENHIDLLEDCVTGPLYKTYRAKSLSVSKINIAAGYVVSTCAFALFVFEAVEFCKGLAHVPKTFAFACILLAAVVGLVALWFLIKGNAKDSGEIRFDKKIYDGKSL